MKNRKDTKGNCLLIGTTAEGIITTGNILFPKKNIFVKPEKTSYSIENKESYKEFKKVINDRVALTKSLIAKDKEIELLKRKNTANVIANSLNKIIVNSVLD